MTALWTAAEAAAATGGALPTDARWMARGVSIDTRAVAADDLFVALKGPRFDGHDFVGAAIGQGAAAALVERPVAAIDPARLIVVPDSMAGLEALAIAARARSAARIVAVTGSVGKTGTKEMLALALGRQGSTHASAGNLNNHIGLPLSLARMPASARFGVFELGMNHAGEIAPLSAIARPHVAIITTVEAVHIENFPDVAAIADAKAEIFTGMDSEGVAILNRDNPHYRRLADHAVARGMAGRIWDFGQHVAAQGELISARQGPEGTDVRAAILGEEIIFRLNVPGRHHVFNALAVLLAIAAVGADVQQAADALADFTPVKGRGVMLEIPVAGGGVRVIDESYNASPAAVRAALAVLAMMQPGAGGRRLVALGDMLELGAEAPALHAALAEPLADADADLVFTAGPLMRYLHDALPAARRGEHAGDSEALAAAVKAAVRPGDIVLVKGSAGSKMAAVVAALNDLVHEPLETRLAL